MAAPISLVIINHRADLFGEPALRSVALQHHKPTEIVYVDMHPAVGKVAQLKKHIEQSGIWFSYVEAAESNLGEARNMAAHQATTPWLAYTVAEADLPPNYLLDISKALNAPSVQAAAGHWYIACKSQSPKWQRASYVVADGYFHPFDDKFHPSGANLALKKDLLLSLGGFPEWLSHAADDTVLVKALRKKGHPIALLPRIAVGLTPLPNKRAYLNQAYQQGLGEGQAHLNYLTFIGIAAELLLRLAWGSSLLLLWAGLALGWPIGLFFLVFLVAFLPGFLPYKQLFFSWLKRALGRPSFKVLLASVVLFEQASFAYFKGYRKGYFFQTDNQKAAAQKLKQWLQ